MLPRVVAILSGLLASGALAAVPVTLLPDDSPGRCMDGTPSGFILSPASTVEDSDKWVIFLGGGGSCATAGECVSAIDDRKSSKDWPGSYPDSAMRMLVSSDADETPGTVTWNRVYVMYCSQDLWSGTRTETSDETFGYYFSGHLVVQEVVAYLKEYSGFDHASDVVVGGASAGGIGAWINTGWIRDSVPKARTVVATVAGWYGFSHPYAGPNASTSILLSDFREHEWPGHVQLWQSHVDEDCATALGDRRWACMLSNNSRPHIRVPAFVIQEQTDLAQLFGHEKVPMDQSQWTDETYAYVRAWSKNTSYGLHTLLPGDGVFTAACYAHGGFSKSAELIADADGRLVSYGEAFARWYAGEDVHLADDCGILCGHCSGSHMLV